jgi:hypothetical protein
MNSQQLRSALQQAAVQHKHHPVVEAMVAHLKEEQSSLYGKLAKADSLMELHRYQGNLAMVEKQLALLGAKE